MAEGCAHYRRGCEYLSPCCNRFFGCRFCHDEAMYEDRKDETRHRINRHEVKQVRCYQCKTVQPPAQHCCNCSQLFGAYFCSICNFFDNDTTKEIYHCVECHACRVGRRDQFNHCNVCGGCFSNKKVHRCLEGRFKDSCSVCTEELFFSRKPCELLSCGHIIHSQCLRRLLKAMIYNCPLCRRSFDETEE
mmetsp:Transcript_11263/g.22175  ORF Transcript_11263/g.22175 Transcript_11263/m.22175 type:complete len:190 (+) Transcript_11263:89-658(+)